MSKLNTTDLVNLQNEVTAVSTINSNFTAVETAIENTLSRDGTTPNTMSASLDMNSNRVLNLPLPTSDLEPLRLIDAAGVTIPVTFATDGDKGDITVSGTGAIWTIDNDVVTYAKIQNVSAASKLLGRGDSGAGDIQEITLGTGLAMSSTTLNNTAITVPGGSNTQIQFNSSSAFGASANLTWVSPALTIGVAGSTTGLLKLTGATSGTITVTGAATAGTWTLTLPQNDGDANQFLQTDGAGITSWVTATAAPGGSNTQVQFNDSSVLGGDAGLTYNKTTNILSITAGGLDFITSGTITFNSDVSIVYTANTLTFAGAGLGYSFDTNMLVNTVASSIVTEFATSPARLVSANAAGEYGLVLRGYNGGAGYFVNTATMHATDPASHNGTFGIDATVSAWEAFISDGAAFRLGGAIQFRVDGTHGSNDVPTRFSVYTTPDGSGGLGILERFRIGNSGQVTIQPVTATPAGGSTAMRLVFGTTAGFGIYVGSGAPTVTAAQGSLYLRSDGTFVSRAYINTDGGTTWTTITTAA